MALEKKIESKTLHSIVDGCHVVANVENLALANTKRVDIIKLLFIFYIELDSYAHYVNHMGNFVIRYNTTIAHI